MGSDSYRTLPESVVVFEVGPRDGLQIEKEFIPTEKKIQLIDMLSDAGCTRIEASSFVHPKWVPQMRDAKEVFAQIKRAPGAIYSALIPNMRGLELAIESKLDEVITIMSSSESHNRENLNMSVADSLKQNEEINRVAKENGVRVRSYIATAFGCPMEGDIPPKKIADIAEQMDSFGSYEISLGDTTGMANPESAYTVPTLVRSRLKRASLAVHYHQWNGIEFANVLSSLEAGITVFDGAAGGLGGCPYAPGATGNIATEDLVELFYRLGISCGIDREEIRKCGEYARQISHYH
jgi:hydroxymethylglutaryl-CoA lyase